MVSYNGIQLKDLYTVTIAVFTKWYWVVLYTVCMITLAFHLSHGFASAFQTLGLNHKKYTPFIKKIGLLFSLIVPAAFASIPIYIYFMEVMN
jgi:succinate dehydrogenase / fumarate reductase cytochrome b subunit